jgi:polyhydroxyalkanoate depolymerase
MTTMQGDLSMLYWAYELQSGVLGPLRLGASGALQALALFPSLRHHQWMRPAAASWELLSRMTLRHQRPAFGIDSITTPNGVVSIAEEAVMSTPFGTLLHFRRGAGGGAAVGLPAVLVVSPLSGHFATLLRDTVRTLLSDHEVYITDWHNARDVSLAAGAFGFEEYVEHVIAFLDGIGTRAHVVAVCQPCVQVIAAVALMAQDKHPSQPRSMTLMAGPVDVRSNPTQVNQLAQGKPLAWFEDNLIARVPWMHPGARRRVYPGFVQLTAFMAMNMNRHTSAHEKLYHHLARGEHAEARVIKSFYDEYFAVLDLPAEFFLETVDRVFQRALLARGELTHRGRRVDPGAIRRTALLTVEGERDDICGIGQTAAAHDMCSGLRPYMKRHHMQPGVGHYGVFSGRRWEAQVYPIVRNMILSME